MSTTHYNLPEFTANGSVDLIGVYNAAMQAIDTAMYNIAQSAVKDFDPKSTDTSLTVSQLNTAKVTANGIIYDSTKVNVNNS